jgi:hypothetical protein
MGMTMHRNYEWIVAWASGQEVEFKDSSLDGAYDKWCDVTNIAAFSYDMHIFRIKPKKVRTVGYKRYVTQQDGKYYVVVTQEGNCSLDLSPRRWLDKEWRYEEVEQ